MSVPIRVILNTCERADLSVLFWAMDEMVLISRGRCLPQHLCVIQGVGFDTQTNIPALPALPTFKSL